MIRFAIDGLDTELIDHAVVRHVFIAIADRLVFLQAIIQYGNDGDLAVGGAVRLGNKMGENRSPEIPSLLGKELPLWRLFDAIFNNLPRRIVPEGALRKRAEAGIIAGLTTGLKRFLRGRIAWKQRSRDDYSDRLSTFL
jgi:hypothetical protein